MREGFERNQPHEAMHSHLARTTKISSFRNKRPRTSLVGNKFVGDSGRLVINAMENDEKVWCSGFALHDE